MPFMSKEFADLLSKKLVENMSQRERIDFLSQQIARIQDSFPVILDHGVYGSEAEITLGNSKKHSIVMYRLGDHNDYYKLLVVPNNDFNNLDDELVHSLEYLPPDLDFNTYIHFRVDSIDKTLSELEKFFRVQRNKKKKEFIENYGEYDEETNEDLPHKNTAWCQIRENEQSSFLRYIARNEILQKELNFKKDDLRQILEFCDYELDDKELTPEDDENEDNDEYWLRKYNLI